MLAQQPNLPTGGGGVPGGGRADESSGQGPPSTPRTRLVGKLGESRRGVTWSARQEDGSVVAAKQLKPAITAPDVNDLARVANVDRSHLVPVRTVVRERGEQWVLSELDGGLSLRELLRRGRPPAMCCVAIAMDVLDGLAELHRAGLWHGAVHSGNVHIGTDGTVRLSDYGLSVRGSANESSLRVADVSGVGVLLCALLGIAPDAGPEGSGRRPSRRAAAMAESPIGVEARRMVRAARSRRATGYEAVQARLALWEAAGRLANRRNHAQAKSRLAELVGFAPAPPAPQRNEPRPPRRSGAARVTSDRSAGTEAATVPLVAPASAESGLGGVATRTADGNPLRLLFLLALIAGLAGAALALTGPRGGGVASTVAVRPATSRSEVAPPAGRPVPDDLEGAGVPVTSPPPPPPQPGRDLVIATALGPPSAGPVSSVVGSLGSCDGAGLCAMHVEVWIAPAPAPRPVSWQVVSLDACAGSASQVGGGSVIAQPGWNHVIADGSLRLTAAPAQWLGVVTQQPSRAASPLVLVGASARC